ncbi:sensor histidine kinase [Nonomuraea salmonea]|uniref:sensor histidine kinase n=1 Tax=Nonomuraea salmonea TaxID=46181 RepID=UPI003CD0C38B
MWYATASRCCARWWRTCWRSPAWTPARRSPTASACRWPSWPPSRPPGWAWRRGCWLRGGPRRGPTRAGSTASSPTSRSTPTATAPRRSRSSRGDHVIEVRDRGPGFPPELLAEGPRRFRTGAAERGHGHGLGLTIAAGQARVIGAELTLTNAADGGAVATLRLPASEEHHPPEG